MQFVTKQVSGWGGVYSVGEVSWGSCGLGWGEEAQNMCTVHAVDISELSSNYLVNQPTRGFVRASRGQRSFLLGCRDVPQYKVMKYLVFGVISSSLLPHMTTRIRMRMQSIPDRAF